MRLLHLYRPQLPGLRAQAIQVVHTCRALADLGFKVTLLADRSHTDSGPSPLDLLGLTPHTHFDLKVCPTAHPPSAGMWFRAQLTKWWMGAPGVVLARDKRRLTAATGLLPQRHRIVLETHELDSALAIERGEDPQKWLSLEAQSLAVADALVANCPGTLREWRRVHGAQMPALSAAVHNATAPDRRTIHQPPNVPVLRYMGSLRTMKGLLALLEQTGPLSIPLEIIGATQEERTPTPPGITVRPPVPYTVVPELIRTASAVLLPLTNNYFGQHLSSPLKLWDYLASTVPIVAADVGSVQEILTMTSAHAHTYDPEEPQTLHAAIAHALQASPRASILRTWADRAQDLASILRGSP